MWPLFKIVNFFFLLVSSYFWMAFMLPGNIVTLGVSLLMIVCFALGNFRIQVTPRVYALLGILMLYSLYMVYILDFGFGASTFFTYLPAALIFMLNKEHQEDLLGFVTKWFAILMAASIAWYGLSMVVSLPHTSFMPAALEGYYANFDNYGLFVVAKEMYQDSEFNVIRFSGPFLEPGHQSMICVLLMFANRFNFKKNPYLWILLLSTLLSLSLAGYVMLIIGLSLIKIRRLPSMIGLVTLLTGAWLFVTVIWNDGQNPVNVLVVERLEFDEQKGIKGNNRTIKQTDHYFRKCVDDGTIWLGVQSNKEQKYKIRGAGYKIFMLRYGIVSLLFVATIYLMLINPKANRRFSISFFLFICIIFLQRAYPGWYSWLLPYVLGIGITRDMNHLFSQTHHNDEGKEEMAENMNDRKETGSAIESSDQPCTL